MNTTLQRASEITSEFSHGNWDAMFPASRLEFEDFDHVTERGTGNVYRMMDSAKRLISQRLRLPADYLARCPRDLQAENLNYWLSTLGDIPLFCRFKDQSIRAFFTRRYKPIDNTEVMGRVQDSFAPHTRVEFKISNEMMLLNIPDHSMTFKVFDDQMVPGCHFSNSEVGLVAYSCSVFYQRLICTNGLISADTIAVQTRHIKRNALDDFNATMEEVRRLALVQTDKMRISVESKVDDPRASINSFGKRFGHTLEETQEVQNAWDQEPGNTLWAVIQAFTYAADGLQEDLPGIRLSRVIAILNTVPKDKEFRMIEERVERFKCSPEFHTYLVKVLERLPEDVLHQKILDVSWLEIVSFNPNTFGRCLRLHFPTCHLIVLNEAILEQPEPEILHTIAHELGHMVAGSGKTGLWEKEAEDLVKAWGFKQESREVAYEPAILEDEGYQVGYQWAANQEDLSDFKEFFGEWSRDALACDRCSQLIELVQVRGVLKDPSGEIPRDLLLLLIFDDKDIFKTAVAYGVMSFLGKRSTQSEEDLHGTSAGTMEETFCQCDWCGRDIKYGNASLSIDRIIQQAEWDPEYGGVRVTVIDGQPLITLCARCAGKMNHHAIPEALATGRYDPRKKPDPPVQG